MGLIVKYMLRVLLVARTVTSLWGLRGLVEVLGKVSRSVGRAFLLARIL